MNFGKFLLYTFLGSLPWCLLLAYAGQQLGPRYETLSSYFHGLDVVIVVAIVALAALYIYRHVRNEQAYDANLRAKQDPDATKKMPRVR